MKHPWMPLYIGDYLADTAHLGCTQHGAYLLLIMHYWQKGGLPDDDRQLAKITRLPLKIWEDIKPTIQDFFHDGWQHVRCDDELAKMHAVVEKRRIAGQKGGMYSGMARQKLASKASRISHVSLEANASQSFSNRQANVNHSHSHIDPFLEAKPVNGEKPKVAISEELRVKLSGRTP
jgi:uncharacterized protein YdaU (DUF1376 family)